MCYMLKRGILIRPSSAMALTYLIQQGYSIVRNEKNRNNTGVIKWSRTVQDAIKRNMITRGGKVETWMERAMIET